MDATILGHVMRAPLCRCFPSLFIVNWTYFEGGKLLYLYTSSARSILNGKRCVRFFPSYNA